LIQEKTSGICTQFYNLTITVTDVVNGLSSAPTTVIVNVTNMDDLTISSVTVSEPLPCATAGSGNVVLQGTNFGFKNTTTHSPLGIISLIGIHQLQVLMLQQYILQLDVL
jgi:hypothetical protein